MSLYTLERLVVGAQSFRGLTNVRFAPQIEAELRAGGSELDATLRAIHQHTPLITFDCLDVAAALGILYNTTGAAQWVPHLTIAAGNPAKLYFQVLGDGITRGTAASNQVLKVVKGLLVPTRVAGDGALAVLSCALYADYDGTNLPVQVLTAQSLLTGAAGAAALARLMAAVDNTTVIHRISEWSIDFGIKVVRPPSRSVAPLDSHIAAFEPRATFRTADVAAGLARVGFSTAAAGAAGLQFMLGVYNETGIGVNTSGGVALVFRAGSRIAPRSLDFTGDIAQLEYEVIGAGAGDPTAATDSPLQLAVGQTMPVEAATNQTFQAGPAYDGQTRLDVRGGRVDFNIALQAVRPANQLWPVQVLATARTPEITLTVHDQDFWAGLGAIGRAIDGGFAIYLRSYDGDGLPLEDGDSVHTQILFPAGWIEAREADARHAGLATGQVRVIPTAGTDPLVTISTTAQIGQDIGQGE